MDPNPQTIAYTYSVTPVPRKFPVPEGPPGPPPVNVGFVALPVIRDVFQLVNPVAANIAALTRQGIAGTPDAIRTLIEAAPSAATVFGVASGALGAASLAAGLSGAAAKLLAAPTAAVPYLGAGTAAWAALSTPVAGALGIAGAGFQALATGSQAFPMSQWGQLAPQLPALAIPPPPNGFV